MNAQNSKIYQKSQENTQNMLFTQTTSKSKISDLIIKFCNLVFWAYFSLKFLFLNVKIVHINFILETTFLSLEDQCKLIQNLAYVTSNPKCPATCIGTRFPLRFGNQFMEFMHMLRVALALKIRHIQVYPGFLLMYHSFYYENIFIDVGGPPKRRCVQALFFETTPEMRKLPPLNILSNSFLELQHFFSQKFQFSLPNNTLVIHVRSGDIFSSDINPDYGQPPCRYYLDIIKMRNWSKIILISQDTANPCVNILRNSTPKVEYTKQSLRKDLLILLNAEHIVMSRGSFIPAVIALSKKVRTVFSYNVHNHSILMAPIDERILDDFYRTRQISNINCVANEQYRMDVLANWTRSDYQLHLLKTAPACSQWEFYNKTAH